MRVPALLLSIMCFIVVLTPGTSFNKEHKGGKNMTVNLTSTSFSAGGIIPPRHTCDGNDISPPLQWSGIPAGTKSFALICDDPDAPGGDFVHWVIFNIPPDTASLAEGYPEGREHKTGIRQGRNDFGNPAYGGPCPPGGVHRYFFRIFALDNVLNLPGGATKQDLLKAMKAHILGQGELMGRYTRR